MKKWNVFICLFIILTTFVFSTSILHADEVITLSKSQTIYVPAYSHIYSGNIEKPFLLTVILSVRNIDPMHKIKITMINYYDGKGTLLNKLLADPLTLEPLESLRHVIPEKDKSGGSGANFIVKWESDKLVNPPIIESVMIGTQSQQGISFTSRGRAIIEP